MFGGFDDGAASQIPRKGWVIVRRRYDTITSPMCRQLPHERGAATETHIPVVERSYQISKTLGEFSKQSWRQNWSLVHCNLVWSKGVGRVLLPPKMRIKDTFVGLDINNWHQRLVCILLQQRYQLASWTSLLWYASAPSSDTFKTCQRVQSPKRIFTWSWTRRGSYDSRSLLQPVLQWVQSLDTSRERFVFHPREA